MDLYIRSLLLGFALAMDACAVSMANGLNEPKMRWFRGLWIAFMFGLFQALMPLIGYLLGRAILSFIEPFIPWIALLFLVFIGGKMIYEGIDHKKDEQKEVKQLTFVSLIVQAIATSIDALSAGFTIANYTLNEALICVAIIMIVTLVVCFIAVQIGKKFGDKLGNKAEILGGIILIGIGLEIFITGII